MNVDEERSRARFLRALCDERAERFGISLTPLAGAMDVPEFEEDFRLSAAGNLEVRKVVASLDAKLPSNLTHGEWKLGPGGCAVVELTP